MCTGSTGAFSVGIAYEYYKQDKPLFVKPKYSNFKQEILNYKHIKIDQYQQEILTKADIYHETNLVKSMKSQYEYIGLKYCQIRY